MSEQDYEIVPFKSLNRLKDELEHVKRKTNENAFPAREVMGTLNELKDSIQNLLDIFHVASQEMKIEEREAKDLDKKIAPLIRKVDNLIDQNQEIAKGIVVIADMIKEHIPKIENKIDSIGEEDLSKHTEELLKPVAMQKDRRKAQGTAPQGMPPGPQAPMPEKPPGMQQFGQPSMGMPPGMGAPGPMQGFEQNYPPPRQGIRPPAPNMPPPPSGMPPSPQMQQPMQPGQRFEQQMPPPGMDMRSPAMNNPPSLGKQLPEDKGPGISGPGSFGPGPEGALPPLEPPEEDMFAGEPPKKKGFLSGLFKK